MKNSDLVADSPPAAQSASRLRLRVSLASLTAAFGFIGLTSFGGARAAYFRHVLVAGRRWMSDQEFLEGLTISQVLPGPNVSNLSVYLGQRLRGIPGALLAVTGVLMPGAVMILGLSIFYFGHGNAPVMQAIFKGVGAAAVGLSLATTLQVGAKGIRRRRDLAFGAATFLAVGVFHLSLVIALLTIAPLSVWFSRPRRTGPAA